MLKSEVKTEESRIFGHRPALPGHPSANGRENAKNRPLAGQSGLVIGIAPPASEVPLTTPSAADVITLFSHARISLVPRSVQNKRYSDILIR